VRVRRRTTLPRCHGLNNRGDARTRGWPGDRDLFLAVLIGRIRSSLTCVRGTLSAHATASPNGWRAGLSGRVAAERLGPGTRVGPYEVVATLGSGGMSEVYRARDTRLDREVAIKVVGESLAGDAGFLAGLEQEARLAGSLNHPNIVAVHDVGSMRASHTSSPSCCRARRCGNGSHGSASRPDRRSSGPCRSPTRWRPPMRVASFTGT